MILTLLGLVCLGVAALGILACLYQLARARWREHRRRQWDRARVAHLEAVEALAIANDVVRNELMVLEMPVPKPPNYRHNLHCPTCGRFSARVTGLPDSVVECHAHGVVVRVMPVDWSGPIPIITAVAVPITFVAIPVQPVAITDGLVIEFPTNDPVLELEFTV